jgi:PadR family transcriptional regulator PadR
MMIKLRRRWFEQWAGRRLPRAQTAVLRTLLNSHERGVEPSLWAVTKATHRLGPTVLGILERLERAGWITSRWEHQPLIVSHLPRRRLYTLTPAGVEEARRVITACRPPS